MTRETIRWHRDADRRRHHGPEPAGHVALAVACWTAADGDPLTALLLAVDRISAVATAGATPSIGGG